MLRGDEGGDYMNPERFTVEELREVILQGETGREEGRAEGMSRLVALQVLGQKEYPEKVADLRRILLEEGEAPRLRQSAAILLGRTGDPEAVPVLERAAAVTDRRVLRGVLEGLAVAGRPESLEALAPLARRRGSVGRAVARTTRLLRSRTGAPGPGLRAEPGVELLRPSPLEAVGIEVAAARGGRVERALLGIRDRYPALELSPRSALALTCQGRELLLFLSPPVVERGGEAVAVGKTQAAVVAEHTTLEGDAWEPKFHVLTEPSRGRTIRITVVSPRGEVRLTGTGRREGDRVEFSLVSVRRRGAVAVELEGALEGGRVVFSRAVSETTRIPAAEPTRLDGGSEAG